MTADKILVPLDGSPGSETVLARIGPLAQARGATVRLVHVAPPVESVVEEGHVIRYADQEAARVTHAVAEYLRAAGAALPGVPVETVTRFGDPVEAILSEAVSSGAGLIAMATHRRSGLRRLREGSVAERVMRASPVPLFLVTYGGEEVVERAHTTRRRFWCDWCARDVEAEFEEEGLPGFRRSVAVRSCTAFDPPAAIECPRRCLDPTYRKPFPSPVFRP